MSTNLYFYAVQQSDYENLLNDHELIIRTFRRIRKNDRQNAIEHIKTNHQRRLDAYRNRSRLKKIIDALYSWYKQGKYGDKLWYKAEKKELERLLNWSLEEIIEYDLEHYYKLDTYDNLLNHVEKKGLSYEGLQKKEAEALDGVVINYMLSRIDSKNRKIRITPMTNDGLSIKAGDDLFKRIKDLPDFKIMQTVIHGRRLDHSDTKSGCGYCFLSSSEVQECYSEIQACLKLDKEWSSKEFKAACVSEILNPFSEMSGMHSAAFCCWT